jgi:hypothetical protein
MNPKLIVIALTYVAACGKDSGGGAAGVGSGSGSGSAGPSIAMPAIGVESPSGFDFTYGKGKDDFAKATAAYKAPAKDWSAIRTSCEAALAKDAGHLDARRLLASALVQLGDHAAAVDHLVKVIAADWRKYGAAMDADPDLATLWSTPHGKAVEDVGGRIGEAVKAIAARRVLVLGRRAAFKWPSKPGAQWAATRAEVYAVDVDTRRFVRLTHTDHSVAAILPSPSGGEIAVVGYDKVEMPPPDKQATVPPLLARAWVQAFDPATWEPTAKRATLTKVRGAGVGYAEGDQLVAQSHPPSGRWMTGPSTSFSIDRATGKLAKIPGPKLSPSAMVALDMGWIERTPASGIEVSWDPATEDKPALAKQVKIGAKVLDVPGGAQVAPDGIVASPGGKRFALSTWVDPCNQEGTEPSIYVVDAATGALKHLLTGKSRFRVTWVDDERVLYEDGTGSLRLWSAADGREVGKLASKPGLFVGTLDAHTAPICRRAPPVVEPATGDEMPPEDTGSGDVAEPAPGPATTP